ncbi:MAG: hypothetical protein OEV73_01615 [Desulfobulbaceae bacterium]|nr:hypothetical protein [Desulfobulbaceae bacterium]
MCIDVRKTCECGSRNVQFHLRDNIMSPEAISRVFCPSCPGDLAFNAESMLQDNGWVIEYDMILARFLAAGRLGVSPTEVTPAMLFDQGYACWLEMYPGEKEAITDEKEQLLRLRKEDQTQYLTAITAWNIERVNKLKAAGWRKALRA